MVTDALLLRDTWLDAEGLVEDVDVVVFAWHRTLRTKLAGLLYDLRPELEVDQVGAGDAPRLLLDDDGTRSGNVV